MIYFLQIKEDDNTTKKVCLACCKLITAWYKFRKQAIINNNQLTVSNLI